MGTYPLTTEWMIGAGAVLLGVLILALVILELRDWLRARRRKP